MNIDDVRERLRVVEDPDLGDDIVSLGLVNSIDVTDDEVRSTWRRCAVLANGDGYRERGPRGARRP